MEGSNSSADWLSVVEKKFEEDFSSDGQVDSSTEAIFWNFIDEALLEVVFDAHKLEKELGPSVAIAENDTKEYISDQTEGYVFDDIDADTLLCFCPRCPRRYAVIKFTDHFKKCVGGGRSSSQQAKLKIADNFAKNAYGETSDKDDECRGPDKPKRRKMMNKKKGQKKNNIKRGKPKNKKK